VAERLGVHYMTVYRYVRTGRLDATQVDGKWLVSTEALESFQAGRRDLPPAEIDVDAFERLLLNGDAVGAWTLIETRLYRDGTPFSAYEDLIVPSMQSVGRRWAAGELTIAQEHRATVATSALVGRLATTNLVRGRRRGTLLLGAVAGDNHSLPTAIVADVARNKRFDTIDLGANVPAASFVEAAGVADRLVGVALSCSITEGLESIPEIVKALREVTDAPLLLGGAALDDVEHALSFGADASAATLTETGVVLEELVPG
jgi:excisionase family DNA binding protein